MSEGPAAREHPALLLVRLGMVALALLLLWVALDRLNAYQREFVTIRLFSIGPVVLIALLASAGGLAFGLAILVPAGLTAYRWPRAAILGVLPLGLTVAYVMIYSGAFQWLPSWVYLPLASHADAGLIVSATLLGLALAGGLRLRPPG